MNRNFNIFFEEEGGAGGAGDQGAAGGAGDQGGAAGAGTGLLAGGSGEPGAGQGEPGAGGAGMTEHFFKGLYDETGKIDKTKFELLPEHLKQYRPTLEKYDDIPGLIGGLGNLASLAGKKGLQPLPEGADEKAKEAFNSTLKGVLKIPDDPKAYGIQRPETLSENLWDQEYGDKVAEFFQANNIPVDVAQALVALDSEHAATIEQQAQEAQSTFLEEQKTKLNNEFGAEFDRKMALAKQTALKLGLDPDGAEYANQADYIIALTRVAAMIGEQGLIDDGSSGGKGLSYRDQALAIIQDPSNPKYEAYHTPNHPQHKSTVDEVTEMNRLAARS